MRAGRDELGDGVCEGCGGGYVEDRDRVSAVVHAAFGEDDGDEVDAGRAEEWEGGGLRKELCRPVRS